MKGDFSVWQYNPIDNDQGVLYQQGRVTLDRDQTDAERIAVHWRTQAAQDVIGARVAAVPAAEPEGFFVESAAVIGGDVHLQLRSGRAWVDGILLYLPPDSVDPTATIDRVATYFEPPLNPATLPAIGDGVRDVVVLEVALEELNAFQDPLRLLEPALGGPDTTERITARYGFRLLRLDPNEDCNTILDEIQDGPAGKGRLSVSLDPPIAVAGDCPTVEGGGYTGFEHNLFRVEIAATNGTDPQFKWSRFNGGLVGTGVFETGTPKVVVITGNRSAILNTGEVNFYLEALRFNEDLGHWEVTYGALAHVNSKQDLELTDPPVFGTFSFSPDPVFFRLWNGIEPIGDYTDAATPEPLVDGIHLVFESPSTASYRSEDYWTFPVRAGEIQNPEQLIVEEPPHGVVLHRVPLAEINWTAAQDTTAGGLIEDCRKRFRPLTNQKVCCTYLIGDGSSSFGDFNSLEVAALHLPATGGELCLLPGVHFTNLTLTNRSNIKIHGCGRRTLVFPRSTAPTDPIFRVIDCVGIEIVSIDLAAPFGPVIVATGTVLGQLKDITVQDCRMLAGTYAVQILRAEQVTIARNQIWMRDMPQGRAAIQVRAHQALIERNALGVWPIELTPPADDGNDGSAPPSDPADPCAEPGDLYDNLPLLIEYLLFIWTTGVVAPPTQPYLAWGGIHLLGDCENIRVLENRIDGGAGHGVTLGGLLPGETGTPPSQDPSSQPTVSLLVAQFEGLVRDESNQPVTGIDVSLSQSGAIKGQGTSAGTQASVSIKVDAGTYVVAVEPGYEIVQISVSDVSTLRLHTLVIRAVDVQIPEERAFLDQITIRENEILRMAFSGIGFMPYTLVATPPPPPDLTDPAAIAAFFATIFAPRILLGTTNIVRNLTIAENHIHDNLRVVFTPLLRAAAREVGQGGISLALVEDGRIVGNHIHDNGVSAIEPIAGVFIGYAENVEIVDNYVTGNGAITENYETDRVEGIRGGIYVRFASALLVGGESTTIQKPAVRIIGNRVDQPAGRAVSVMAFGPVTCQGNYLNSERTGRFNFFDAIAGGVLIINIGGLQRQQRFTSSDQTDNPLAELLPGGEVLFNDNQIRLGTQHRSLMSLLLMTLDDLGFDGNQSNVFRRDLLFANAVTFAFSQRATDNRFREDTRLCFFSLLTYSFGIGTGGRRLTMNTTMGNQGDHCIYAASNAIRPPAPGPYGPPVVYQGNMEVNFDQCRSVLGEGATATATIRAALLATLFAQQATTFNPQTYIGMANVGLNDATSSIRLASYEYRNVYATEAARREKVYGRTDARAQRVRQQVQRSGAVLQQLDVVSEVANIREHAVPLDGTVFDGRVTDTGSRGQGRLTVELVRADDTPVGATTRTDESGYFAIPLDKEQAAALSKEKKLFVRVKDDKGNIVHRDTAPMTIDAMAPVRATVVLTRHDIPADVLKRGDIIYTRPGIRVPSTRSTPLESVRGIGPVTAARLRQAGITDVETLLQTSGERLVQIAGFDADVVRRAALDAIDISAGPPRPSGAETPKSGPAPEKGTTPPRKRRKKE